ncbi:RNA-binding protein, putative [Plasmodium vivax]|uniref:RNA-binding protein, putative n=6 Tax=Plasmodium vivax TaxID=5855 RepID=A5K6V3_PLAVS|nr:RNA-binding protein, putative [Plasmodium vivax]KMZ81066.1 RNA-binding protein [Plasmodium vivax India VII]KMZ87449.1 RNA-binding protein [Plasmodium vivax Brazil I]KMZ93740.1 RNA-binding protein [Plasmodium vivax Mauritania I]KNA00439.1 RNA-binding protein [Plasmodium vivax North Korean]EDL45044.1 RNA-binding protein, putative [Plasmodium vivax]|eukprot:XP_001614771.1 RNA-binding protein [Plasmodium vivax Sal-1]
MEPMNLDQMNHEKGDNDGANFNVPVDDINSIDKEFSDLQKLKMMNEGAEMQMNQSGALDSHEMEQEEINNRSIFVGNVDYSTQPEELQSLFSECGLINRVTILVNKNTGHSKGYAYIEFADASSVRTALSLSESFFKKRQIKVCSKRRNIPGFNRPKISPFRGRSMKATLGPRGRLRQPSFRPFYRGRGSYKKIVTNPYERA